MKKLLLIICGLFGVAYGQTTGYFRYDTTRFEKNGGNNEVYIRNGTKSVTGGVLTNVGNGLSRWIAPAPYGDSLAWKLTGNAGTTAGTNFIGTTDSVALWLNTKGVNRLIIPAAGIASSTASTDSVLVTKTDGVTLGKIAKTSLYPTWQQTLTAGSTLTGNNTIAGGGHNFTWNNAAAWIINSTNDMVLTNAGTSVTRLELGDANTALSATLNARSSEISLYSDSIQINPYLGNLHIDTLTSAPGTKALRYNPTSGLVSYSDTTTAGSSLTAGYGILLPSTAIIADTSILVNKTGSQTLTNKTLTSPVINVTSDATGDMYYRNSGGLLTRLPIGTAGQHLVGGTIPAWKDTAAGGGGMAIGGSITSATAGSVLFAGTSGVLAQDNSKLFWDNTNKRLGIGTATPTYLLDVNGQSVFRDLLYISNGNSIRGLGNFFIDGPGLAGTITMRATTVNFPSVNLTGMTSISTGDLTATGAVLITQPSGVTSFRIQNTKVGGGIWYFENNRNASAGSLEISNTISDPTITLSPSRTVGIGTYTPAASSILDITSTTKGLLIPRMTTAQRDAISSPATALQIFSTTDSTNYLYRGTTSGWQATLTGIRGSGTLDFGSIAHHSEEVLTISVTGAAEGDVVSLGIPNASNLTNVIFTAWVSAANTVSIKCSNLDQSAAKDPTSGTFKVTILKF